MNNNEYIRLSLELHLFFDRIMKEHSFFIEAAFTEKNNNLKQTARKFQEVFSNMLKRTIVLADRNISNTFLQSNEIVTKNTVEAEKKTNNLAGSNIDTDITIKELNLKSGRLNISEEIINNISTLNRQTLPIVENLITFKNDILNSVLSCKMYTTNYPLLISHIMNEAKMYYNLLNKVEQRSLFTKNEIK